MTPIAFIGGLYGSTQAQYDATLRTAKPHNITEFWTGHLPKGTPFLTSQWNQTPVGGTFNANKPNPQAVADLIIATFGTVKVCKLACHSYGGHAGLAAAQILIAQGWQIPFIAIFDGVDYDRPGYANTVGLTVPAGVGSVVAWYRGAKEMPWSTFVSGVAVTPPGKITVQTTIENILYPRLAGESVDAAHARYVWDAPTIARVAAA